MSWGGRENKRLAELVIEVWGTRCAKCGGQINLSLPRRHPRGLSIGHQLPRSRGGSDDISNLRPEHFQCNLKAGARLGPISTARAWDVPGMTESPGFLSE